MERGEVDQKRILEEHIEVVGDSLFATLEDDQVMRIVLLRD